MGLAIGLKTVINKTAGRLFFLNALVFFLALVTLSVAVYYFVMHNFLEEEKRSLWNVADTVINSIQSEHEESESGDLEEDLPDLLQPVDRLQAPVSYDNLTFQWFDASGKLLAHRGSLVITTPLKKTVGFQQQAEARALILTRPIPEHRGVRNILRVGIVLQEHDKFAKNFFTGLVSGTVCAMTVSSLLALWLVRQALWPIEQALAKLKQFTSDASHELKGPLMAIKTNASVALKYDTGMRQKDLEKFTAIRSAADQVIETTNDLLLIAECESHSSSSYAVDVFAAIESTRVELLELALSKGVKMSIADDSSRESIFVAATKRELSIVLRNVVTNAIQYSYAGGAVTIVVKKNKTHAIIIVSDNGIGIKDGELPFIFDRFWRSDKARSYNSGGNGLGLAIAQSIVSRLTGKILVRSSFGEGTVVSILLPSASLFQ